MMNPSARNNAYTVERILTRYPNLIRALGVFDDPRIHAAVVCASVDCPMPRNEAFVADYDWSLNDAR